MNNEERKAALDAMLDGNVRAMSDDDRRVALDAMLDIDSRLEDIKMTDVSAKLLDKHGKVHDLAVGVLDLMNRMPEGVRNGALPDVAALIDEYCVWYEDGGPAYRNSPKWDSGRALYSRFEKMRDLFAMVASDVPSNKEVSAMADVLNDAPVGDVSMDDVSMDDALMASLTEGDGDGVVISENGTMSAAGPVEEEVPMPDKETPRKRARSNAARGAAHPLKKGNLRGYIRTHTRGRMTERFIEIFDRLEAANVPVDNINSIDDPRIKALVLALKSAAMRFREYWMMSCRDTRTYAQIFDVLDELHADALLLVKTPAEVQAEADMEAAINAMTAAVRKQARIAALKGIGTKAASIFAGAVNAVADILVSGAAGAIERSGKDTAAILNAGTRSKHAFDKARMEVLVDISGDKEYSKLLAKMDKVRSLANRKQGTPGDVA